MEATVLVKCTIPADNSSSFPPLAVARKIVDTHSINLGMHLHHHFHPHPPPALIINHSCPCNSSSSSCPPQQPPQQQQQVIFSGTVRPSSISLHCTHHPLGSTQPGTEIQKTDAPKSVPDAKDDELQPTSNEMISVDSRTPVERSPSCSPAAQIGLTYAAELLDYIKAIVWMSDRNSIQDGWDSIIASKEFHELMHSLSARVGRIPLWIADPESFKAIAKKVCSNKINKRRICPFIEDLLDIIDGFERAGLIDELELAGFHDETLVLRNRAIFYEFFARVRVLEEASLLLQLLRLRMGLPTTDPWWMACKNSCFCGWIKEIGGICGFPESVKTLAWRLDKLESSTKDIIPLIVDERPISAVVAQVGRLLNSPLLSELAACHQQTYLDTAICLLQHYRCVMNAAEDTAQERAKCKCHKTNVAVQARK